MLKVRLEHVADVLRVRQVQRSVDLVQDVERGRLEEQQGQDEGQSNQRPLAAAQLRQRLLPLTAEGDANLETIEDVFSFGRSQLGVGSGQEGGKDGAEVLVDLVPGGAKLDLLLLVEFANDLETKRSLRGLTPLNPKL